MAGRNPWKTLSSRIIAENPWFRLRQDLVPLREEHRHLAGFGRDFDHANAKRRMVDPFARCERISDRVATNWHC